MPLVIIDWVHPDYSIYHGGRLRDQIRMGARHVEGQLLEVYEGWLGRESVRMIGSYLTGLLLDDRILLPRDEVLKYGVVPKTWVVYSVSRAVVPGAEEYISIYPRRIVTYVPSRDLFLSRLEDLMLRATGLSSAIAGIIYRTYGVVEEVRSEARKSKKEKQGK